MPDVNVLIYAHRQEPPDHDLYANWLQGIAEGAQPFALSELVASSFVRIVTQVRAFDPPTELDLAVRFIDNLRRLPNCRPLRPGPKNWSIFVDLCASSGARGKLIADAYHAALAMEHGCELITVDSDFARFPGLRWRHPLQAIP